MRPWRAEICRSKGTHFWRQQHQEDEEKYYHITDAEEHGPFTIRSILVWEMNAVIWLFVSFSFELVSKTGGADIKTRIFRFSPAYIQTTTWSQNDIDKTVHALRIASNDHHIGIFSLNLNYS